MGTEGMVVDSLIKDLIKTKHQEFVKGLNMVDVKSTGLILVNGGE
jgi:hypothetical protein